MFKCNWSLLTTSTSIEVSPGLLTKRQTFLAYCPYVNDFCLFCDPWITKPYSISHGWQYCQYELDKLFCQYILIVDLHRHKIIIMYHDIPHNHILIKWRFNGFNDYFYLLDCYYILIRYINANIKYLAMIPNMSNV